ncbi:DUF6672 family protein [Sphaerochaeta globosa]|uniref:Uncharacterized protein n=1 Tax=Sphaerochaeta globosa (strain ATCC BAA-1886 / DSM 22777 / Buddy) TaxID=158189 RepID=F0RS10_SPHGB|nr:DUF6672 family protein [Sphaerochaeta globosa]ADY14615.1 hypothetical protein SpiBuddy_2807 [Sphaerochaeta globosa str. Buddy]
MSITFNRKTWIRLACIVLILVFSVFLFFIGRMHTVLVDNKTVTVNGTEVKALQLVEVQLNKLDGLELAARDRDKFEVTGQTHKVTVIYTDSNWEEHTITRKFTVPLMQDMVMVLVPALVANADADQSVWLQNYAPPTYAITAAQVEESVVTDDLAGLITEL